MSNTPSIMSVAKAAGVAKTTVSAVLNGKANQYRICRNTQVRILAAVKELGYQPNAIARNIALGNPSIPATGKSKPADTHTSSGTICLALSAGSPASILALIPGLDPVFAAEGYRLMVITVTTDPATVHERLTNMLAEGIMGFLACPTVYPAISTEVGGKDPVIVLWQGAAKAMLVKLSGRAAQNAPSIETPLPHDVAASTVVTPVPGGTAPGPTPRVGAPVNQTQPLPVSPVTPTAPIAMPVPIRTPEPAVIETPAPAPIETPPPASAPTPVVFTPTPEVQTPSPEPEIVVVDTPTPAPEEAPPVTTPEVPPPEPEATEAADPADTRTPLSESVEPITATEPTITEETPPTLEPTSFQPEPVVDTPTPETQPVPIEPAPIPVPEPEPLNTEVPQPAAPPPEPTPVIVPEPTPEVVPVSPDPIPITATAPETPISQPVIEVSPTPLEGTETVATDTADNSGKEQINDQPASGGATPEPLKEELN